MHMQALKRHDLLCGHYFVGLRGSSENAQVEHAPRNKMFRTLTLRCSAAASQDWIREMQVGNKI